VTPVAEVFNTNVEINGSEDVTQLKVKGHTTQTAQPLQSWQSNDATELARVTGNGRVQAGSIASMMSTDEALVEVHRSEDDTSKPRRGLHVYGGFKDALNVSLHWIVQELRLVGNQGVKALHTALRVRLTNANTGDSDTGQLRAGQIEVVNQGGNGAKPVSEATGLLVRVENNAGAYVANAYGLKVEMSNSGSQAQGYALYTDQGTVHLGDTLEIPVLGAAPVGNPPANFVKTYVRLENNIPRMYSKDSAGVERVLVGQTSALNDLTDVNTAGAGNGKVLTYDSGVWVPQAPVVPSAVPTGSGMPYFGASAPAGWLLCDGTAVSRSAYADLYAVIGDTYKRFTTLAARSSDTAGSVDLGYSTHGLTAGSATVTLRFIPAAAGVASVNTTTDVLTTSSAHYWATGDKVRVTTSGTLPGGLTPGTDYYVRAAAATTVTLHPTVSDALANTNAVNITSAGTGTHTLVPQDETSRSGMTVDSTTGSVLTLSGGNGHILPAAAVALSVECASGQFFLPDMRGRVGVGAGQGSGLSQRTLGSMVGEEDHQLTIAEMPGHRHTSLPLVSATASGTGYNGGNYGNGYMLPLEGGDQAHNTMQPSLITQYIIKA
jgi:microcystin-dependent protein